MKNHQRKMASAIQRLRTGDDIISFLENISSGKLYHDAARIFAVTHPTLRVSWFLILLAQDFNKKYLLRMKLTTGPSLRITPNNFTDYYLLHQQVRPFPEDFDFDGLDEMLHQEGGRAILLQSLRAFTGKPFDTEISQLKISAAPVDISYIVKRLGDFACVDTRLSEFSLIIPSYRDTATRASLEFHSTLGIPAVAAVTHDIDIPDPPKGTVVVHDDDYVDRIGAGLDATDADFVMLLGDDDFAYPQGLIKAVEHLRGNPSTAAVDGYDFDLHYVQGLHRIVPRSPTCAPSGSPMTRMNDFFSGVNSFANLVRRTTAWRNAVKAFKQRPIDHMLFEIMMDYTGLVTGPTVRISELLYMRSRIPTDVASPTTNSSTAFLERFFTEAPDAPKQLLEAFEIFHDLQKIPWNAAYARKFLSWYCSFNALGSGRRVPATTPLSRVGWINSIDRTFHFSFTEERAKILAATVNFYRIRYM